MRVQIKIVVVVVVVVAVSVSSLYFIPVRTDQKKHLLNKASNKGELSDFIDFSDFER